MTGLPEAPAAGAPTAVPWPDRLRTARLLLRKPRHADASRVFAVDLPEIEIALQLAWHPEAVRAQSATFIADCLRDWDSGVRKAYVLTLAGAAGEPIGMLEARLLGSTVELGYVLAHPHRGAGLMTEAIAAVTTLALAAPAVSRVQATCDAANRASARVLEKVGFTVAQRLDRRPGPAAAAALPAACLVYARHRPPPDAPAAAHFAPPFDTPTHPGSLP